MTLLFVHMQKTAGTTLKAVMERQYEKVFHVYALEQGRRIEDLLALSSDERATYDLVMGHFDYGLHEHFPNHCEYVTMLRWPVDRVLSRYAYVQREPDNPYHSQCKGMTLREYLESGIDPEASNGQTRRLGDLDAYIYVGLQEAFDRSLLEMKRRFGWRDVTYKSKLVAPAKPQASDEEIALIRSMNEEDISLYETVRTRFRPSPRDRLNAVWFQRVTNQRAKAVRRKSLPKRLLNRLRKNARF